MSRNHRLEVDACIDPAYPPETSIVLRYRNAFPVEPTEERDAAYKQCLEDVSLGEGARIFPLMRYRGVDLFVLDETSFMHTKTMRSIAGCVIIAKCRLNGYDRVVFESGGNSGSALAAYGQAAGMETFFFLPEENVPLMNSARFAPETAHLIAVEKPGEVKRAARLFHEQTGIRHVPLLDWRYEASRYRGYFLLEHILEHGGFDWITQTISAAFGPIGIYSVLCNHAREIGGAPRFLGIQQEANCPMYRAWRARSASVEPVEIASTDGLISRILYDVRPHTYGTFDELKRLLEHTGGDMTIIDGRTFVETLTRPIDGRTVLETFRERDMDVPVDANGLPVERTGLMALVGTLKEIDAGTIARGSRVLCCLTSALTDADGRTRPEWRVPSADLEASVTAYGRRVLARTNGHAHA